MTRLTCTLAASVLLAAPALAQTILQGGRIEPPVLGRFFDPQTKAVHTLYGVAGAGSASTAETFSDPIRYAANAPHRPWAIIDRTAAGTLELATFTRTGSTLRGLDAASGVDQIAFSPSGDAAIFYYRGSRVETWKGFSATPTRAASYSLDGLGGELISLAVADDASVAGLILGSGDSARLYALTASISKVGAAAAWSAVAFAPDPVAGKIAYVANRETNEVRRFANFGSDATSAIAASDVDGVFSPSALAVSMDGRKLIVANQDEPSVAVVDLETHRSTILTLERAADGLFGLAGNAVFQLSASPKPEIFLLDADAEQARITVVSVEPAPISAAASSASAPKKGAR